MTDRHDAPALCVPLGPNFSVDGGPFSQAEARGRVDGHPQKARLVDQNGHEADVPIGTVADAMWTEMRDSQPIRLNTGGVYDVPTWEIPVPLIDGYSLRLHKLPGQGNDVRAVLGNLEPDELRYRHFERKLPNHGGTITG